MAPKSLVETEVQGEVLVLVRAAIPTACLVMDQMFTPCGRILVEVVGSAAAPAMEVEVEVVTQAICMLQTLPTKQDMEIDYCLLLTA